MAEKTFIKITNREIYELVQRIDKKVNIIEEIKTKQTITDRLIYGSYGFSMIILGWLIAHVMH